MLSIRYAAFPLTIFALVVLLGAACGDGGGTATPTSGSTASSQPSVKRLNVVTTIYVLQLLAQEIGGGRVEVTNLTPTGAQAHDWQPTPRGVSDIQEADIFIFNGTDFEPWVERALESLNLDSTTVLDATEALASSLLAPADDSGGAKDPHVWLDPGLYARQAEAVKNALAKTDPEGQGLYTANLLAFQERLKALEQEWQQALASCAKNRFVTNHAAFGYLANRFGLEQVAISGLSPEIEPSPAHLRDLVTEIRGLGIRYIFFETLVSARVAETLAREVGAETLPLNPLEGLTDEELEAGESYFTVMQDNLKNLEKALECR